MKKMFVVVVIFSLGAFANELGGVRGGNAYRRAKILSDNSKDDVISLYRWCLDRDPSPEAILSLLNSFPHFEIDTYTSDDGRKMVGEWTLKTAICRSEEARLYTVKKSFRKYLGREATEDAIRRWLGTKLQPEQLERSLSLSEESVQAIYMTYLHRMGRVDEVKFWIGMGLSWQSLVGYVATSDEARKASPKVSKVSVQQIYRTCLYRTGREDELQAWIDTGLSWGEIVKAIVHSYEAKRSYPKQTFNSFEIDIEYP